MQSELSIAELMLSRKTKQLELDAISKRASNLRKEIKHINEQVADKIEDVINNDNFGYK